MESVWIVRFVWLVVWLSITQAVFQSANFVVTSAIEKGWLFGLQLSLPWVRFVAIFNSLLPTLFLVVFLVGVEKWKAVPWFDVPSLSVVWIDKSSSLVRMALSFALCTPIIALASWVFLAAFYELFVLFHSVWVTQFATYIMRAAVISVLTYLGIRFFNENIFKTIGGTISVSLLLLSPIPYMFFKMPTKDALLAISAFLGRWF